MPRTSRTLLAAVVAAGALALGAGVAGAAPTASTPPTISGTATVGSTLTCTNGTWSAGAGSFAYRWTLASGGTVIGRATTLVLRGAWADEAVACSVTGTDTTGTATATSAPVSVSPASAAVTITSAREISTATRRISIAGRITPTASLAGGAASLILYRETSEGLQQLSFTGSQSRPTRNGSFDLLSTGEPTGTNTYVVQYIPSALGYAPQTIVTRRIKVVG